MTEPCKDMTCTTEPCKDMTCMSLKSMEIPGGEPKGQGPPSWTSMPGDPDRSNFPGMSGCARNPSQCKAIRRAGLGWIARR